MQSSRLYAVELLDIKRNDYLSAVKLYQQWLSELNPESEEYKKELASERRITETIAVRYIRRFNGRMSNDWHGMLNDRYKFLYTDNGDLRARVTE